MSDCDFVGGADMEEEVRAAGGELEPEEERESDDADQTSDSSSLKERGGRVRDRKRSNTVWTSHSVAMKRVHRD